MLFKQDTFYQDAGKRRLGGEVGLLVLQRICEILVIVFVS